MLETDVRRKVDLDNEVKASGFATQEEMRDFDQFNQDFLDNKPDANDE